MSNPLSTDSVSAVHCRVPGLRILSVGRMRLVRDSGACSTRSQRRRCGLGGNIVAGEVLRCFSSLIALTLPGSVARVRSCNVCRGRGLISVRVPIAIGGMKTRTFRSYTGLRGMSLSGTRALNREIFRDYNGLAGMALSPSLRIVPSCTFRCYNDLTSMPLPSSLIDVKISTFERYSNLSTIIVPGAIAALGGGTCRDYGALAAMALSSNLRTVPGSTFQSYNDLISVPLPPSLIDVKANTFTGYGDLASISVPGAIAALRGNACKCDV